MRTHLALAALLLGTAACSASSGGAAPRSAPAGPTVELRLLEFGPDRLTVEAGTTVTWRSAEPITHTVTSGAVTGVDPTTGLRSGETPDGRFDGHLTSKGATFTHAFRDPGTYSYYCSIHKGMNATVVVTA